MYKVRGAARAETASGTGRPRGIEANGDDVVEGNADKIGGDLQTVRNLLEADVWPLLRECRMLAQSLDEKLFFRVH
jgi:hypothetical protein